MKGESRTRHAEARSRSSEGARSKRGFADPQHQAGCMQSALPAQPQAWSKRGGRAGGEAAAWGARGAESCRGHPHSSHHTPLGRKQDGISGCWRGREELLGFARLQPLMMERLRMLLFHLKGTASSRDGLHKRRWTACRMHCMK